MSDVALQSHPTFYFGPPPITVQLRPVLDVTDEQLFELSQVNRDLRIERNAQGELVIMPPTGGETGKRNAELIVQLGVWAKRDGTGSTFDSSTGFRLPNTAVRSPDASWIRQSRLEHLTPEERKKFIPLCPDFVVELRSATDSLRFLQEKMQEYMESGASLGWLIDVERKRVYVYRPRQPVEELSEPSSLQGDPLLSGFVLDLNEIW
jgi:Uma2 family endonuclease